MKEIVRLARMGEEAVKLHKLPRVCKKVRNAFDAKILDVGLDDLRADLEELRLRIAKGATEDISNLARLRLEIEKAEKKVAFLREEKDALFGKAKSPKKELSDEDIDALIDEE